jgi:hypothetical protein
MDFLKIKYEIIKKYIIENDTKILWAVIIASWVILIVLYLFILLV